jgi:hypothetical protein
MYIFNYYSTKCQYTARWISLGNTDTCPDFKPTVFEQTFIVCLNYMEYINLLKSTGYVTHQQFNIQQLYALPTLYFCVLYLSENKLRLVSLIT